MPEDNHIHHDAAFSAINRAVHAVTEAQDALARCRGCSNACPILKAISLLLYTKGAQLRTTLSDHAATIDSTQPRPLPHSS